MPLNLNTKKQITVVKAILSQKHLNANDCSRLIVNLRELAEITNKSDYPMINLYGDLSVHAKLDRTKYSIILNKIEDQSPIPEFQQSTSDLIAELFSIRGLQNEILSYQTQIPELSIFNNRKIWFEFVGVFLSTLTDKPLFQKNTTSQIEQMYLKTCDIDTNGTIRHPSNNPLSFVWVIQLRPKNVKIYCKFQPDYRD